MLSTDRRLVYVYTDERIHLYTVRFYISTVMCYVCIVLIRIVLRRQTSSVKLFRCIGMKCLFDSYRPRKKSFSQFRLIELWMSKLGIAQLVPFRKRSNRICSMEVDNKFRLQIVHTMIATVFWFDLMQKFVLFFQKIPASKNTRDWSYESVISSSITSSNKPKSIKSHRKQRH